MSILGRKISGKAVAWLAAAMIVAALLPVMTEAPVDREITLVVRDMTFYLDGEAIDGDVIEGDAAQPNPAILVKRGERVRVVVKNDDRGMTHDFAVPALGAATSLLDWNEHDAVTFTAPDRPGTYDYVCNPHLLMMKGRLKVY
jgi:plastocyanin